MVERARWSEWRKATSALTPVLPLKPSSPATRCARLTCPPTPRPVPSPARPHAAATPCASEAEQTVYPSWYQVNRVKSESFLLSESTLVSESIVWYPSLFWNPSLLQPTLSGPSRRSTLRNWSNRSSAAAARAASGVPSSPSSARITPSCLMSSARHTPLRTNTRKYTHTHARGSWFDSHPAPAAHGARPSVSGGVGDRRLFDIRHGLRPRLCAAQNVPGAPQSGRAWPPSAAAQ